MDAYSYVSSGGGMVLLLLILGAIITYLFFFKGFWLDKYCQDERKSWGGEDIEPEYNIGQSKQIHEAISQTKSKPKKKVVKRKTRKKKK